MGAGANIGERAGLLSIRVPPATREREMVFRITEPPRKSDRSADPSSVVFWRATDVSLFDRLAKQAAAEKLSKAELTRQCITYALDNLEEQSDG